MTVYEYMGVPKVNYWWCANCNSEIGGYNVTHDETCVICGYPVIIKCSPDTDGNLMVKVIQKMRENGDWDDFIFFKFTEYKKTLPSMTMFEQLDSFYTILLVPANFFRMMQEALEKRVIGGGE